jgi:tRNA threonylcarbamoyladenosine biosynthesis protein TsaB
MKILALDSTALTASVALIENERLLALTTLNNGLTHSETLLPMVESLLHSTGNTASDIDIFACSAGPGSFTGVRIGASTIKGLAFGRGKVCIGVSTLHALAYNLICCDGIIAPVMNARRNQVYNALFECKDGRLKRLTPDRAISVPELDAELSGYEENICLCGDGYEMVKSALIKTKVCDTPEPLIWQNGYSVAACALELYQSGVRTTDTDLVPTYLRLPQAERERLEKLAGE